MAGAAAFTGLTAGIRVLDLRRYDFRAALGLTLGGIPGACSAAFVVKSLPLDVLRWLVVVVIVYTAAMMLRAAYVQRKLLTNPNQNEEIKSPIRPTKFAHIVYQTRRFEEMVDWYQKVFRQPKSIKIPRSLFSPTMKNIIVSRLSIWRRSSLMFLTP